VDALGIFTEVSQEYPANDIICKAYVAVTQARLFCVGPAIVALKEAYDHAVAEKKLNTATINNWLVTAQLLSTRATYPVAKFGDHRICNHCMRLGINLLPCECGRAWYCDVLCKCADSEKHVHPHFQLELLPAVLVRHHILPLCLSSVSCGLALRRVNRLWRGYIDDARQWWLEVIPQSWRSEFQPPERPFAKGESVRDYILQLALKQCKDTLERRAKKKRTKIKLLDRKRMFRNDKITGLKREIEDIDREEQLENNAIQAIEAALKRCKE
jgi:hypothetical protein